VGRYWRFVIPAALLVGVVGFLLFTLNSNLVYFNTPTELVQDEVDTDSRFRLGGQVADATVVPTDEGVNFEVTDGRYTVPVVHRGAPPQLFQEGTGVVVEGTWDGGTFFSDSMLVKHDEQYRTDDGEYEIPEGDPSGRGAATP
jgi:cytochrome c-type biogenesis protein CcmE